MKILVLSDSHKHTNRIDEVLATCGKVDQIVFCGDVDDDCDYIGYVAPPLTPIVGVCGNNDFFSSRPYRAVFSLCGVRFYVTHGHLERVKSGHEGLVRAAKEADCSVVLFGHTHRPCDAAENGIRLINPGALSASNGSYAIITIENDAVTDVEFKSI